MIVRICDVCKLNPVDETQPGFYKPPLLEKRFEHAGFDFEFQIHMGLEFNLGEMHRDLCESCAWPALLKACRAILAEEDKADPNHVIIDYQNNPSDWEVDAPGSCGCPKDGGDRRECAHFKRKIRPAILFAECDCACHGDPQ